MAHKAYCYARVSNKKQLTKHNHGEDEADSLSSQDRRAKQYYEMFLSDPKLNVQFGSTMFDRAVSASKIPFDRRPAAVDLMRVLLPGDHVIVDKVDRIYRSLKDFVRQNEWFKNRGVAVHYLDLGGQTLRTDSPFGEAMLQIWVCFAQLEAANIGERLRAANKEMRMRGIVNTPQNVPCCCKIDLVEGVKTLIWDDLYLEIARRVVELRDLHNKSWRDIAKILTPMSQKFPFTNQQMGRLYETHMLIAKHNITEPTDIFEAKAKEAEEKKQAVMMNQVPKLVNKHPPRVPADKKRHLRKLGLD